jgi:hypothetical protein
VPKVHTRLLRWHVPKVHTRLLRWHVQICDTVLKEVQDVPQISVVELPLLTFVIVCDTVLMDYTEGGAERHPNMCVISLASFAHTSCARSACACVIICRSATLC